MSENNSSNKPGWWSRCFGLAYKSDLEKMEKRIMAKVSELQTVIDGITTELATAKTNIQAEIVTIEAQLASMDEDIPAALQTSVDNLKAIADGLSAIPPAPPAA